MLSINLTCPHVKVSLLNIIKYSTAVMSIKSYFIYKAHSLQRMHYNVFTVIGWGVVYSGPQIKEHINALKMATGMEVQESGLWVTGSGILTGWSGGHHSSGVGKVSQWCKGPYH
jgi:hypothetical protein